MANKKYLTTVGVIWLACLFLTAGKKDKDQADQANRFIKRHFFLHFYVIE